MSVNMATVLNTKRLPNLFKEVKPVQQINIHEVKTHFSTYIDKAAAGEPFIITKYGRPLVTVIPYVAEAQKPRIGFLKGRASIPDDFDRMGSD